MGLFLLLTWVVCILFGITLTLKWSKNFRYRITPFLGYFNSLISGVSFTPEKEFFKLLENYCVKGLCRSFSDLDTLNDCLKIVSAGTRAKRRT